MSLLRAVRPPPKRNSRVSWYVVQTDAVCRGVRPGREPTGSVPAAPLELSILAIGIHAYEAKPYHCGEIRPAMSNSTPAAWRCPEST